MGCEHVLDSSLPCFEKSSLDLCAKVGVTVGFDAVAGEFSGKMLKGLSSGGVLYVYSEMATDKFQDLSLHDVIFAGRLEVFLPPWLASKTTQERAKLYAEVQRHLKSIYSSDISQHLPSSEKSSSPVQAAARLFSTLPTCLAHICLSTRLEAAPLLLWLHGCGT